MSRGLLLLYLFEKYTSKAIVIPKTRSKFIILPCPKYIRTRKKVNDKVVITPLRLFIKTIVAVKNEARKKSKKKNKTIPKVSGSTKNTIRNKSPQRKRVINNVGRKFLRSLICFFLKFFRVGFIIDCSNVKIY